MYNFNENINTKSFDVHFHENKIRNRLMYFFHKNKNTKSFDVHFQCKWKSGFGAKVTKEKVRGVVGCLLF
jgi:hypothetical protein